MKAEATACGEQKAAAAGAEVKAGSGQVRQQTMLSMSKSMRAEGKERDGEWWMSDRRPSETGVPGSSRGPSCYFLGWDVRRTADGGQARG